VPIPTWSVGQVLAAADVNNWFVPIAASKPSDTSRASTTTQTADPDLTIALAANASYIINGYLGYANASASAGDLKYSFTAPASNTTLWSSIRIDIASGTTTIAGPNAAGTANNMTAQTSSTSDRSVHIFGTVITAGSTGNLTLNWAQNTSNATATIIRANSYLMVQRIG